MSVIPHETLGSEPESLLDRVLDFSRIRLDVLAFGTVVVLSILAHLWGLERMGLHHDESIHAWLSWRFYTGSGGFVCAGGRSSNTYCYDPVYHGPALYVLTLLSYFLFGDGDAQSRFPQAIAGIGMVASAWMLRPYLGTRGALLAAILLAFTPSLLYYTRFARHDGLMVLWTLWIVIGFFRYLHTGRPGYLYLMAAGAGLAVATHELYYILAFIFGWFLIIRVLFELWPRRRLTIILLAILGAAALVEVSIIGGLWNGRLTTTLRADGLALLFLTVAGVGLLMIRVFDPDPIVTRRAAQLWNENRQVLWIALGILGAIYILLYSTFFANPGGILDGFYWGLAHWLGSQQEFKRGDQPWYYYLALMALYEPLALFGGIGAAIYLLSRRQPHAPAPQIQAEETAETDNGDSQEPEAARETPPPAPALILPMVPLFLAFWFLCALVVFSWAGEKMPWLNTHIALPGNLLIAWALNQMLETADWRTMPERRARLIPAILTLLLIALAVAFWRMSDSGPDQQGQANALQGLIPLLIGGGLLYTLLTIAQRAGARVSLALCGLTIAALVGAYTIRATWMVVYNHPDTARELLIYTQTSPDVPLIVREIREIAISQTRNSRSARDPIGGLTMPVIMDSGDSARDGEGSLAWPYQWYLRDFQRIENRNSDFFRTATADSYLVDSPRPEGEKELAPVVLISNLSLSETGREALEANYVKRYDSKLNWWFPEGNKCDPESPGYKRFYYSYPGSTADFFKDCRDGDPTKLYNFFGPLLWPLDRTHWSETGQFLMYRTLPEPLRLDGREMQVWVRKDLAPGGGGSQAASNGPVKLVAQKIIGQPGKATGQLDQPRGIAVDQQGTIYVADTGNHRIQVFGPDGALIRSFGTIGNGPGQFYEPRGVVVDQQGNIYVADTWNARVVKLNSQGTFIKSWGQGKQDFGEGRYATVTGGTQEGNIAEPLGFFGPRALALDPQGNLYIADTGNKRIVVTDTEGNFRYQWGYAGSNPGAFNEPIGVAVDRSGNVYVADTWNGRVQVFAQGENGQVNPLPSSTWPVSGWQAQTYDDPFIAVLSADQVALSVPGRNAMVVANGVGAETWRWGGAGKDAASMNLPSGVAFGPDGSIYVADRGNGRIMVFKLP